MSENKKYKLVLGLEIHLHVKTSTKMFCGCDADVFRKEPNTHTCPTCLGLPGALPVPNFEAVEKTQLLGLALKSKLNENSRFDRKHYFYPDLPKGFQISQYKQPLCEGGYFVLDNGTKVELERIHIEEDTAKSFHEGDKTLVDFNVSGIPLMEIVTKPVFDSTERAVEFSKKLRDLVRLLGIGDADMEKGQLRIEPNISLRTAEMEEKGELPEYKVEIKNINSFRFMNRAVKFEIDRQTDILEKGDTPLQENRGWDEKANVTVEQRWKEEAQDYRYFPEPDIPPMAFDQKYFDDLKKGLPELPWETKERLISEYKLSEDSAGMLTTGTGFDLLGRFEKLAKENDPQKVANLLINKPEYRELDADKFKKILSDSENKVTDEDELSKIVEKVVKENPDAVSDYEKGKENAVQFLLGQVMRETRGKADPKVATKIIEGILQQE